MRYKYKNLSDQKQDIIGVGVVGPGQEFTTAQELNNPNFQFIESVEKEQGPVSGIRGPQPNMVTDATPVKPEQEETE